MKMKTSTKFFIITLVFAVISYSLNKVIWPETGSIDILLSNVIWPEGSAQIPTGLQLPLLILLAIIESVSFGVGMAFLFLGWKYIKELMPENKKNAMWSFVSIVWLLVSWWPHDNMHRINAPSNLAGLIKIEYMFHVTLILAGCILVYNFWKLLSTRKIS